MSEESKAIYARLTEEVWGKGNLDAVEELYAPDVVIHSAAPGTPPGRDGVKAVVSMWRTALTDFAIDPRYLVAEGDLLAIYWTLSGTHSGELMGVPATGKRIETSGMSLVRFEDGKVVEIWGASDQLGLMRTLGVIPG